MIKVLDSGEQQAGNKDIDYYKHVFIDLGCPPSYAVRLASGHIGMTALTKLDTDIKSFMLQGYPYATARTMAEEESGWK